MPFEARNTKFMVISSNHELYNLIESEFQHEIPVEIKTSKQTYVETVAKSWSINSLKPVSS